jgi:hypothetical protein
MPPSQLMPSEEFYLWVGRCITAWAKVEEHLFDICQKSLNTSTEKAAIVYYRTPTLDTRINLVDELVRSSLPKRDRKSGGHDHPDVQEWDDIRKAIGALLHTRRRIAHHPVADRSIEGQLGLLSDMSWIELYMSDAERLRGRDGDLKPLPVDNLSAHRTPRSSGTSGRQLKGHPNPPAGSSRHHLTIKTPNAARLEIAMVQPDQAARGRRYHSPQRRVAYALA